MKAISKFFLQLMVLALMLGLSRAAKAQEQLSTGLAPAIQENVIFGFQSNYDYAQEPNSLVQDAAGNFYGTTQYGGDGTNPECVERDFPIGCGTVFELSPQKGGGWSEQVLYNFGVTANDGIIPDGGLVLDAAGNLYGTASQGGNDSWGTAFELLRQQDGSWSEQVLYNFGSAPGDGAAPRGSLVFDAVGNLYGANGSTVYELSPQAGGSWTEAILHTFAGSPDGENVNGNLIWDPAGNLYGTTVNGGINEPCGSGLGCGTVFELSPESGGVWQETVLYAFHGHVDGYEPNAPLALDSAGNLYGITAFGGGHTACHGRGCGVAFELSPRSRGGWSESALWNFSQPEKGAIPQGGLINDAAGNLYGTTAAGGGTEGCSIGHENSGCGTAFALKKGPGGIWTEKILHLFGSSANGDDGSFPQAGLIFGRDGNLYGTTSNAGPNGGGIVFELTR